MVVATEDLLKMYQIGHVFPDFPENFTPPWLLNSNYVAPTRQPVLYIIIAITTFFMCVVVMARLIVRSRLKKSVWGFDDWLILPAWLLTLGMVVCEIYSIKVGGIGHHSYDLSWSQLVIDYRMAFIIFMLYIWSTLFTKLSIIAFYYRLTGPTKSSIQRILGPLVVFCISLTTTTTFLSVFGFSPRQAGWDLNYKLRPYTALPAHKLWVSLSAVYAVTDIFILVIPMPLVWSLHIRTERKAKICLVFGLGGVACVAIIVRTFYLYRVYDSFDPTCTHCLLCFGFNANRSSDGGYIITIADQLETTIAIIAASLPALSAILNNMGNSSIVALQNCWEATTTYVGLSSRFRSYPTVSSVLELETKDKNHKQLSNDSDNSDTKTLSLPPQQNSSASPSYSSKPKRWRSWRNRNVIKLNTYNDSQTQSTLNNTVDLESSQHLCIPERLGSQSTSGSAAFNGTFHMDRSFDLVIQHHEAEKNSWADVDRRYAQKR